MGTRLKALWYMQAGECFYCGRATWLKSGPESKNQAKARLGVITTKDLRRREATEEHLRRRAEGGSNALSNLVMACSECNERRDTKPVLAHLSDMRSIEQ